VVVEDLHGFLCCLNPERLFCQSIRFQAIRKSNLHTPSQQSPRLTAGFYQSPQLRIGVARQNPWDKSAFIQAALIEQGLQFIRLSQPEPSEAWRFQIDWQSRHSVHRARVTRKAFQIN
jgi:hypothetical protein